jgi:predicted negative regulator of RcsB-dependent stress response
MAEQKDKKVAGQQAPGVSGLEAPEVDKAARPIFEWFVANFKPILIGMGLAILVVAVWSVYDSYRDKQLASARMELGKLVVVRDDNLRIQGLEAYLPQAPAELKQNVLAELAKACMDARLYGKAADTWDKLAASGDGNVRIVATFGRATSLAAMGKGDEALAGLDKLAPTLPDSYKTMFGQQKALCAESAGKWQVAIDAYEGLKAAGAQNKEFYDYKIGELKARAAKS